MGVRHGSKGVMTDQGRYRFIFAANAVLAVVALADIWWETRFAEALTVRDIRVPSAIFSVPYQTHGATVYITRAEDNLILAGWALTAALVAAQFGLNALRKKRAPGAAASVAGREAAP